MIAGTFSVILAGYLMYQKGWRDEDEDQIMEKIIFFGLAIPILGYVFYLGGFAIMNGFKAKVENRPDSNEENETTEKQVGSDQLSNEITKLNELRQSGVLTQEEFDKAKDKLLK